MDEKIKKIVDGVGKRISAYRKDKGLTQPQLGERLNLHHSTISQIEKGAIVPTLPHLLKISELFGLGLDELIFGDGKSISLSGFGPYEDEIIGLLEYMRTNKAVMHFVLATFHSQKEKQDGDKKIIAVG